MAGEDIYKNKKRKGKDLKLATTLVKITKENYVGIEISSEIIVHRLLGPQATQIGFPTDRRNRHGDAGRGLPTLVSMRLSAYGKLPSRDRPRWGGAYQFGLRRAGEK
jgi:hypothetical protein